METDEDTVTPYCGCEPLRAVARVAHARYRGHIPDPAGSGARFRIVDVALTTQRADRQPDGPQCRHPDSHHVQAGGGEGEWSSGDHRATHVQRASGGAAVD